MANIIVKRTNTNNNILKLLLNNGYGKFRVVVIKDNIILPNPLELQISAKYEADKKIVKKINLILGLMVHLLQCSGEKNIKVFFKSSDSKFSKQFIQAFLKKLYNENKYLSLNNFVINDDISNFIFDEYELNRNCNWCSKKVISKYYINGECFSKNPVNQLLMTQTNEKIYISEAKRFPIKSLTDTLSDNFTITKFLITTRRKYLLNQYPNIKQIMTNITRMLNGDGKYCVSSKIVNSDLNFDKKLRVTKITSHNVHKYNSMLTELIILHPKLWFYCGGKPTDECIEKISRHPEILLHFINHVYLNDYSEINSILRIPEKLLDKLIKENYLLNVISTNNMIVKPLQPLVLNSKFESVNLEGVMFTAQIFRKTNTGVEFDSNISHLFLITDKVKPIQDKMVHAELFKKTITLSSLYSEYCEPVVYDNIIQSVLIPLKWFEKNKKGSLTSKAHIHFALV